MTIRHTTTKTAVIISSLMLLFAFVAPAQTASAIEGESIVMSPVSKPIKLNAGQEYSGSFTILNDGTSGYTFRVYAAPYSVTNRQYDTDFITKRENADVYTWVTFSQNRFRLEPGQRTDVQYTMNVPRDAAPGGHYGVLFAETEAQQGGQSIARQKRVGMIVYATVNGEYIESGKEVGVRMDAIQIGYPLAGMLTVENTGNVDFTMKKTWHIKNILGGTVYDQTLEHIILPKTTRDIPLVWENGAWLGLYNVHVESTVLGKMVTHDTLVLIMPAWFLLVAMAIFLAVGYGIWRRVRR